MKRTIIIILLSVAINCYAQNNKKVEIYSISFSPLSIYTASQDRNGGIGINIEIAHKSKNNIYKLYAGIASEFSISIFGKSITDSYTEFNFLYGRELKVNEWFEIDLFGGIGLFNYVNNGEPLKKYKRVVIGFPLQSKLRINSSEIFSLGLQLQNNINRNTNIFQFGIFLQWKL